ncbi:hypothetical protein TPA0905_55020 [Streptomyces olivaceus]|nr:hypothetical protein TPA0905_55020 [Streptomyces olivaceus]
MSIARGGVAVRLPRMSVTSRLVRRVARSEDPAGAASASLIASCVARGAGTGAAVGAGAGTDVDVGLDIGLDVGVVMSGDSCGMDGPRSGMSPSLFLQIRHLCSQLVRSCTNRVERT